MKVRNLPKLVVLFAILAAPAGSVWGQEATPAGPKFHNLRYEEDFSYLGGEPGTYKEDIWDPLKWIDLGGRLVSYVGRAGEAAIRVGAE